MTPSFPQLNETHLDILRELGNIGAGYAATSLSVLMDRKVLVSEPKVHIDRCAARCCDEGEDGFGVRVDFTGEASGAILFLLAFEEARELTAGLTAPVTYSSPEADRGASSLWASAVCEIGNILGASYLRAFSAFTGLKINTALPRLISGRGDGITADIESGLTASGGEVMSVEERFLLCGTGECGRVILFVDRASISRVMSGIEAKG